MRIAICIPDLSGGGAERTRLRTARGLIARGHEVDFLLFRPLFHYPDELLPPTARLFVLNTDSDSRTRSVSREHLERCIPLASEARAASWMKSWMRLAAALGWNPLVLPNKRRLKEAHFVASYVSRERPHCILPSLDRCVVAALLAMSLRSDFPPVIPTFHSVLSYRSKTKNFIKYNRLLGRSAHVVTVSDGVRNDLLDLVDIPPDRVSTIYNPVVTPELDELREEAPEHPWMTDDGPPVVLAVGSLDDQKDYPTLLRAFHLLAKTRDLRLIILGKGERRQQIEECVRSLGLEGKVSLPGWAANPFSYMSRASLFVVSSRFEGLHVALVEALACGCPCVSTDCPAGPSEILEGGRVGPLVPVGDHAALAGAMRRVLDDPPDEKTLMQRAAFFSVEKAVGAYEELIVETVRGRRAPPSGKDVRT